jgi:hypothetical protein
MPYLNAVDLKFPFWVPGGTNATLAVRLYPGFFGAEYFQSPRFVVNSLGGDPGNGSPPIPQPGLNGFQQIGCAEAVTMFPQRSLNVVGEDVVFNIVPPVEVKWIRLPPNFAVLSFAQSSLTLTNVQETDAGTYFAERWCPGISTPLQVYFSTLLVIPPIETEIKLQDGSAHFTFEGRPGVIYALQKSEMVAPGAWQDVAIMAGVHGAADLVDTNRIGAMGFYRVVARLPEQEQ